MFALTRIVPYAFATALVTTGLAACSTTQSMTGRQQTILVPEEQTDQIGKQAFAQIKSEQRISRDRDMNAAVTRVSERILRGAGENPRDWEIRVFDDPTPNAFALPGNKIGINTGLFKVVQNDAQLAAVIGHEVAHVTNHHAAERISREALIEAGIQLGGAVLGVGEQGQQLAALAAQVGLTLPFSRNQEAEADAVGLRYMARAGYDPHEAVNVWRNFARVGGSQGPTFLATHPSTGDRAEQLEALIPDVMQTYREAPKPPRG